MRLIDADALLQTPIRITGMLGGKYPFEAISVSAIENAPTIALPGGWISVKDRLPETNNKNDHKYEVLVYIPKREGCRQNGIYVGKINHIEADEHGTRNFWGLKTPGSEWTIWGWGYLEKPIVTHWMPLPEPPKEESNGVD